MNQLHSSFNFLFSNFISSSIYLKSCCTLSFNLAFFAFNYLIFICANLFLCSSFLPLNVSFYFLSMPPDIYCDMFTLFIIDFVMLTFKTPPEWWIPSQTCLWATIDFSSKFLTKTSELMRNLSLQRHFHETGYILLLTHWTILWI